MVRLKGKDNLDDVTGKLTAGFNAVTLKALERQYAASGPSATKALTDFYLAASRLGQNEKEFNRRAQPKTSLDLKRHLRSEQQFEALRNFEAAKQNLLSHNPEIAEQIIGVVGRNLASATKPTAKRSFSAAAPAL